MWDTITTNYQQSSHHQRLQSNKSVTSLKPPRISLKQARTTLESNGDTTATREWLKHCISFRKPVIVFFLWKNSFLFILCDLEDLVVRSRTKWSSVARAVQKPLEGQVPK